MKAFITGGTGFIGSFLNEHLVSKGHEVSVLSRNPKARNILKPRISFIPGDPAVPGPWQESVKNHDIIINLAGASIFSRWTRERKKIIRESRIKSAANIVDAIDADSQRHITLLNASAVGYYGFHEEEEITENSSPGSDFLASVAEDWEREALKAEKKGIRVVIARFGIVLGPGGGVIGKMIPLFRSFIGGPLGSGKQWFSWVHIDDLVRAVLFLAERAELNGPFNICSPKPVRNRELAKALGKALKRPSFMPVPGFMVRLALGEFGSVVLKGQKVLPKRLSENGFSFEFEDIDRAVAEVLSRQ